MQKIPTKYIFVTGGVTSSLGKGIIAASLGKLLTARGYSVTIQKLDPYINIDPGTMNPYEHGECYVTNDGAETENPSDYDSSSDIDVYTKIGPALYAVEGLQSQQEKDPDGHKDSSNYVMALYCMEHPEVFQGRGLEVGR